MDAMEPAENGPRDEGNPRPSSSVSAQSEGVRLPTIARSEFQSGVWFQAAVSGLWYRNAEACGEVVAAIIGGHTFRPVLERPKGTCSDCKFWSHAPLRPMFDGTPEERLCLASQNQSFGVYGVDGRAVITHATFGCNHFQPKVPAAPKAAKPTRRVCRETGLRVAVFNCPRNNQCEPLPGEFPCPNDAACPLDYGPEKA